MNNSGYKKEQYNDHFLVHMYQDQGCQLYYGFTKDHQAVFSHFIFTAIKNGNICDDEDKLM